MNGLEVVAVFVMPPVFFLIAGVLAWGARRADQLRWYFYGRALAHVLLGVAFLLSRRYELFTDWRFVLAAATLVILAVIARWQTRAVSEIPGVAK